MRVIHSIFRAACLGGMNSFDYLKSMVAIPYSQLAVFEYYGFAGSVFKMSATVFTILISRESRRVKVKSYNQTRDNNRPTTHIRNLR